MSDVTTRHTFVCMNIHVYPRKHVRSRLLADVNSRAYRLNRGQIHGSRCTENDQR